MTRAEILAMPAGAELNALVAEKVMGWHYLPESIHEQGRWVHGKKTENYGDYRMPAGLAPPRSNWTHYVPPCYSTDIAAATTAEEELGRQGLVGEYVDNLVSILGIGQTWPDVDWWEDKEWWLLIRANPLQKCRAMLLAKLSRAESVAPTG